jgi:hypothetical protein
MALSVQQLNDIRAAYAIGCLKPMVETTEKEIELELDQTRFAALSPAELELLKRCSRYRVAALKACREGKYAVAEHLFADTEKLLQANTFSSMGRLIMQSAHEAAVAYLDYRCGRFEIGTEHIYRVLACDEALEETYGLSIYHIHRIRQLLNLVRLKRHQGEGKEALRLSLALMDYLEQKVFSLPFPTTWDARRLDPLPLAPKNFLFEQAMCEMMFLVVGQQEPLADWPALFSQHTLVTTASHCQLSPHVHLWLQAKRALQEHHPDHFCELVLPLVTAGPREALWFWYGIAIDLVLLCKDLSYEPAELLLQTIVEDMSSWRWSKLPPSWKQICSTISMPVHA